MTCTSRPSGARRGARPRRARFGPVSRCETNSVLPCVMKPSPAPAKLISMWVLSETYAASTQREATGSLDEGWRYDYLGRLRLDLLAFRHVVLPDSHQFDGVVFLRSDPAVLLPG